MNKFLYGIDLCSLQGTIDPQKIKDSGIRYAYVKSSQYSSTVDSTFHGYVSQLKSVGIAVGAYHFCFQGSDPEKQMEHFFRASEGLGKEVGELPPMIDWEFCKNDSAGNPLSSKQCVEWLQAAVAKATKLWYPGNAERILSGEMPRKPVVYTYPFYAEQHQPELELAEELGSYPLCYASYKSNGPELLPWDPLKEGKYKPIHKLPKPWKDWTLWQYSGNKGMKVPGIGPDCDRQLFAGGEKEFLKFLGAVDIIRGGHVKTTGEEQ